MAYCGLAVSGLAVSGLAEGGLATEVWLAKGGITEGGLAECGLAECGMYLLRRQFVEKSHRNRLAYVKDLLMITVMAFSGWIDH